MTNPILHLVVSDVRRLRTIGTKGSGTPKLEDYAAVEFGSGWYHEAAIEAAEPAPPRLAETVLARRIGPGRPSARPGLTLVP